MKKRNRRILLAAVCCTAVFVVWTILVRLVDVRAIGPAGSAVGFAALNGWVHNLTGVHFWLYTVTDWLGLVPIAAAFGFAILGLVQWIGGRSLQRVDRSLFVLGGFYLAVMAVYIFFETVAVNFRPVLIDGVLEASYPSSTTLLVLCVMPTTAMQLHTRISNRRLRTGVISAILLFIAFMVIGRLLSGVHWVTDIIGGIFISAGLVAGYDYLLGILQCAPERDIILSEY